MLRKFEFVAIILVFVFCLNFPIQASAEENADEPKITTEVLNQISSWDELVETTVPITGDYSTIKNSEDFDCVWLIDTINKSTRSGSYNFQRTMIETESINYDRLMEKYQTIIEIYNNSFTRNLTLEFEKGEQNSFQIRVFTKSEEKLSTLVENSTSWEELVNSLPTSYDNHNDFITLLLIDGINQILTDPMYPESKRIFEVEKKESDLADLRKNLKTLVDLYNDSHDLKIVMYPTSSSEEKFQVEIGFDLTTPVTMIGQKAIVKPGRKFWNTCYMTEYGSTDSACIPNDKVVVVNGFAYLDEDGKVLKRYYKPFEEISGDEGVVIDVYQPKIMLHICAADGADLGWISEKDVVGIK